jgi:hypothetical protein
MTVGIPREIAARTVAALAAPPKPTTSDTACSFKNQRDAQ